MSVFRNFFDTGLALGFTIVGVIILIAAVISLFNGEIAADIRKMASGEEPTWQPVEVRDTGGVSQPQEPATQDTTGTGESE